MVLLVVAIVVVQAAVGKGKNSLKKEDGQTDRQTLLLLQQLFIVFQFSGLSAAAAVVPRLTGSC